MEIRLQPLRIPTGWTVEFNNGLFEVDPDRALLPADRHWVFFKEDMLQLVNRRFNRVLDLGWYPDGDVQCGRYRLVMHEGDFRGPRLHQFETRDRRAVVEEIERLLDAVGCGRM